MSHTPRSLLDRVSEGNNSPDWGRFVDTYRPLLHRWIGPVLLQPADAEDVVQDVLVVVIAKMPEFRHNGTTGAFRGWLRGILSHRLQNFWRKKLRIPTTGPVFDDFFVRLDDPHGELARQWNEDHDRHLVATLLEAIRPEFQTNTWRAFWRTAIEEATPNQTATELGITTNAVFIARSRVLHRLREEAKGLLDD
ncbi:MAG TPA: sigma-70 family RNA polymerase sigma factor [Fimbriiglobus sp.]